MSYKPKSMGGASAKDAELRLPRETRVKNKQPADKQITAEQILRESKALQLEVEKPGSTQVITDPLELQEYQLRKRKEFEDTVRRTGRWNLKIWVKYAQWEEAQRDLRRARSVFERALQVNYAHIQFYLRYAEMEMRNKCVNHARNVWDRAVSVLPRQDQLWYKYIHMEEMLGHVAGARQIFERWLEWEPDHNAWKAYIRMELRYDETDRARAIFARYVRTLPTVSAYIRYAKFEMSIGNVAGARAVYESAVDALGEDGAVSELFARFAEFEVMVGEVERARAIYQYGLDRVSKEEAKGLYEEFVKFEKQRGGVGGIEDVVLSKKRFQYAQEVKSNPQAYDTWFDYVRLEEAALTNTGNNAPDTTVAPQFTTRDLDVVRDVYERAIAQAPPLQLKHYWQRYIYLWLYYAVFEEVVARDRACAREVFAQCLSIIPHESFTFGKIWVAAAKLEVRDGNLAAARKLYGQAIGRCPKSKIFRAYIDMELLLGHYDRCRKIYDKWLTSFPASGNAWTRYARFETALNEHERARGIYELAITQPVLDMPESVWKAYIDFEVEHEQVARAGKLYERLLEKTQHVKVWLSYASFEATPPPLLGLEAELAAMDSEQAHALRSEVTQQEGMDKAREREDRACEVYRRGFKALRTHQPEAKEEALEIITQWEQYLNNNNITYNSQQKQGVLDEIEGMRPRRVKRKRAVGGGDDLGTEEYIDYLFPEEVAEKAGGKLLQLARLRKGGG